ncbi:uncharacterized protein Z518_05802 [Rhinocladiella mackenziei CBS 650.93]|uniref:Uncharacterized protein n=1 Tax=Rhinocladiella mackenziei CBS 650.93 TaxID=1442369 RepID=A0A0D2IP54_9EURO|nr:uncharacterized protein Z518_05802 [Rhinocladiella mackenziei CBS 650.93]KIX04931.1 hypothetical protein Z518_05802 [Rhinocladiella mackenziei CBS 650.93]
MASDGSVNYSPLLTREEDDHDNAQDEVQNPLPTAETSHPPPTIEVSLPPVETVQSHESGGESDAESVHRPLSYTDTPPAEKLHDSWRHSSLSTFKQRLQGSVTPSLHELLEKDTSGQGTTRQYCYNKQRNRLLRLTIGEWINTLVLCVIYFGILYAYSKKLTISVPQRRIFNALTTGTSLLLGVNLAASLRSYAKLLRWRMLAACYRPLETFDLVMGCDSLINVIKLLWKARNDRYKFWPSRTQICCVVWLFIHLAITILVGIIGLNYNLDISPDHVLTRNGSVSIVDLESLSTGNYLSDLSAIQNWGIRGTVTQALDWDDPLEFLETYYSTFDGHTFYYFQDQNANDSSQSIISSRHIQSYAYCDGYEVIDGASGNLSYIVYNNGEQDVNQSLPVAPGPAGFTAISGLNSTCGPRCVNINAFQAASSPDGDTDEYNYYIDEGRFYICNNTVTQVEDNTMALTADYLVSDLVARMLAGAIGWSDNPPIADGKEEYALYTNSSEIGFIRTPTSSDVANMISSFTMGAISFMDDSSGMYRRIVAHGQMPITAQILHVTWKYAGSILAVIPAIHFLSLMAVIIWANKAIIKDDSHLAIAKVYHTFLEQFGDRGCLLRGDEIVKVLGNPSVVYGWRSSNEHDTSMHIDVFEKGRGIPRVEKPFVEGWYDGKSRTPSTAEFGIELGRRKRYRDVDAAEYF